MSFQRGTGYTLSCRLDDDDAWHPSTVSKVYETITEWRERDSLKRGRGLAFTFSKGIEWVMYDQVDLWKREGGKDHIEKAAIRAFVRPFSGQSCFMFAEAGAEINVLHISHANAGLETGVSNCDVAIIDMPEYMWLYTRHKQADSGIRKATGNALPMTIEDLCVYFGLDSPKISSYLSNADNYGYMMRKKSMGQRMRLGATIVRIRASIEAAKADSVERGRLQEQLRSLELELENLSEGFLGDSHLRPIGKSL